MKAEVFSCSNDDVPWTRRYLDLLCEVLLSYSRGTH